MGACAAQDLRHDAVGYLAMYRRERCVVSGTTAEQRNFSYYRKCILLPFISLVRERLYGWKPGTPIPDALTAVCWNDGANVQLNSIVSEEQQIHDEKMKIITNKHSASRTAVEQPCDLCPCFMSFRQISKSITRSDIPAVGLQKKIKDKFLELSEKEELELAPLKQKALIDFLGCYPSIVSRACPTDSVARGFLLNGMIDKGSLAWPDIGAMLQTCKNKPRMNAHQGIIESKFSILYEEFQKKGIISDTFMMEAGIETDRNYLGEEVHRFSDCEAYQRSKCLSHDYQRERRKDAVKKAVHDKMDNTVDDQKKLDALHDMSIKTVAKLMKFLPRPHECLENQLNSITLDF